MTDEFSKSLEVTTELFKKSHFKEFSITTENGIIATLFKATKKEELINTVCKQLEAKIRECFSEESVFGIGHGDLKLFFYETESDYFHGDAKHVTLDARLFETINDGEFV